MSILYMPNNCSTTGHLPFPAWGGVRATTGELRLWNCPPLSKTFSISNLCGFSLHILIVFNHYRKDSIQNSKRRRGKSKEMIVLDMISLNQNVPVVRKNFWLSTINKTVFQAFCWVAYYRLPILKTCIPGCMAGVSCLFFSFPWTQLHTQGSWWQDDVPYTGYSKSQFRTYIYDIVFEWHRCLFVSVLSYNSQLEGSWPPRALAHLQHRNKNAKLAALNESYPQYFISDPQL